MDMSDFEAQIADAIVVAERNMADLLVVPGVVRVGVGPERREGVITGRAAIVVTVRGTPELPPELDGVPVVAVQEGRPVEAPEIVAAIDAARAVVEHTGEALLARRGVTAVGVGYRRVGDEVRTNQVVLKVFVESKLPPEELQRLGIEAIPREVDGVPTDVEVLPRMRPTASASGSRDDRKDPLVGGISIGVVSKPFWRGTLGAVVFDRADGRQLVLSNQHVLDAPVGTDVIQPAPVKLDDSVEVGFQLDICNPLHFIRLDTPNTTVGTVLAGGAAAVALAAALSDTIDPTRRGQQATTPPPGALTVAETHKVSLKYPDLPLPGTPFQTDTAWAYTRVTDQGDFAYEVSEKRTNQHLLADRLLITDRRTYARDGLIRLFGLFLPQGCAPIGDREGQHDDGAVQTLEPSATFRLVASGAPLPLDVIPPPIDPGRVVEDTLAAVAGRGCRCDRFHSLALLTPVSVDRTFPVVLREPSTGLRNKLLSEMLAVLHELDDAELLRRAMVMARHGCFRYGELTATTMPTGPWKHYFYIQTVNITPAGADPTLAAQIIGGLPVSQNMVPVLDVACGPFVIEDGQFDIEPLTGGIG